MCTDIRRHASADARNLFQPALTSIFFSALCVRRLRQRDRQNACLERCLDLVSVILDW
ncbi:hypothetical protein [Burkholderia sp. LA-2-3-30-S1-D2]|uniref:hypothetical protein n=1 Tax=Burkholderia sp. LA-2-3-30-S1-D2 TaxID=1637862 RepID=UPI00131F29B0|nr:hypothetical protein [Burkholderia sp. LA-2-3-30-S1-D2]